MFSDGKDTYIYSSSTGEVYVRYNMGKKNYEDVFVRMPHGQQPSELKTGAGKSPSLSPTPSQSSSAESERLKDMQLNALKKSQDILNSALE